MVGAAASVIAAAGLAAAPAAATGAGVGAAVGAGAPAVGFAGLIDQALAGVSADQDDAAAKEAGYAAGAPGASLGDALVASDRAEVAWNATVAVRNEVVTAYQSIMNMQF